MNKKNVRQIQIQVLENLAPIHEGTLSLNEVIRLFSHLGDKQEIETCLDQLIDNKSVLKTEQNNEVFYIFQGIARQFGQKWRYDITRLKNNISVVEQEIVNLKDRMGKSHELREIWLKGWGSDDFSKAALTFISRVFKEEQLKSATKINAKIEENQKNQKELSAIQEKLTLSFQQKDN